MKGLHLSRGDQWNQRRPPMGGCLPILYWPATPSSQSDLAALRKSRTERPAEYAGPMAGPAAGPAAGQAAPHPVREAGEAVGRRSLAVVIGPSRGGASLPHTLDMRMFLV